ncbi:MAG: CoA ester lyase [Chloroflexi bacterium]|nr:CoA ester lyase [Chloroflexota bacterium]
MPRPRPIRSWLYAPGNNPRVLDNVFNTGADAVILDLEDAVPSSEKDNARRMLSDVLHARGARPGPYISVRLNHPRSGLTRDDIAAVVQPGLDGLRLPKVEDAETVQQIESWVADAEQRSGMPSGSVAFVCSLESALGIWHAHDIGSSSARVSALGFGAADFIHDTGLIAGPDGLETIYARSQLVLASRVAGVGAPIDSVYTRLDDVEGLERSTRQGRALGFFGRSAIHPRQVATINAVYTPSEDEIRQAREVIDVAAQAEAVGSGALRLPNGDFVDVAIVRRAEFLIRLVESLNAAMEGPAQ